MVLPRLASALRAHVAGAVPTMFNKRCQIVLHFRVILVANRVWSDEDFSSVSRVCCPRRNGKRLVVSMPS
ncbi:hypothetical protein BQ8794_30038 [Mesorhizobium prunaredense]|uniref:Uncharacterized protein n=1 Tax=Mesorhizobium prunaredense TaxID=1631249 RepID=A0A1R3V9M6_9HYPH|nr:hypothetical protein BQ8794_30038 [Mesorhizobium prunaredense]